MKSERQDFSFFVINVPISSVPSLPGRKKMVRPGKPHDCPWRGVASVVHEAVSFSFHRLKTTSPNKLTVSMIGSAIPSAMPAGAWPVNGGEEGREVEVLDVEPVPEKKEVLKSETEPPTGKHNSFARAETSAGQKREGECE